MEIQFKENLIKNYKTLNFIRIPQKEIREEVKRGIYLNLQSEAIATVSKELSAMNRLAKYLADKYPEMQSLEDIDREVFEEYLVYLRTEETSIKYFHSDLTRLRGIMECVGKIYNYENLGKLFLNRDIPPVHKSVIKTYSDAELKRLNAGIAEMDEQVARAMVLHQMLGTRISDTLTLHPDCLYEKDGNIFIRIRQMKTRTYEKSVSTEVAELVRKAVCYTEQRYGKTDYVFVDRKNPSKPMQYTTLQAQVMAMIYKKDLRDDSGKLFGFGTHMYRHYYGIKLAEMHLDDLTIARLLGHQSVRNVKYYRRMSDQILADETRAARNKISQMIMENLDGWGEEYEQIRYDDSLE